MILPPLGTSLNASLLSTTNNGTSSFSHSTTTEVSWQSACWPVVACMVTVMMQSTGRVLDANYVLSAALRASPVVCALDTVMMIAKFICLLHVGCSITTAARHVWYGRFEHGRAQSTFNLPLASIRENELSSSVSNDWEVPAPAQLVAASASASNSPESVAVSQPATHSTDGNLPGGTETPNRISYQNTTAPPIERGAAEVSPRLITPSQSLGMVNSNYLAGSSIDHNWKQSMFAFTIGAAPQALKVFAMRGTPITQVVTSVYVIAFLVPELFRLTAGSAGEVELRPMPTVVRTKERVDLVVDVVCNGVLGAFLLLPNWWLTYLVFSHNDHIAMQIWLFLGPAWIMCQVFIRIWAWLSGSPVLGPPIAYARRLGGAQLEIIYNRLLETMVDITVVGTYTLPGSAIPWVGLGIVLNLFFLGVVFLFLVKSGLLSVRTIPSYVVDVFLFEISYVVTFPFISLLLYDIFFIGSLSKTPRRLTGVKGSMGEFVAAYVTLISLFTIFYVYSQLWTSEGTYKPAWADYLG